MKDERDILTELAGAVRKTRNRVQLSEARWGRAMDSLELRNRELRDALCSVHDELRDLKTTVEALKANIPQRKARAPRKPRTRKAADGE